MRDIQETVNRNRNRSGGVSVYSPVRQIRRPGQMANAGTAGAVMGGQQQPQPGGAPSFGGMTAPAGSRLPGWAAALGSPGATGGGTTLDRILAASPQLSAQPQEQPGGWKGMLGTVVNSGPGQAIMSGLNVLDMPRRLVVSGVQEAVDAVNGGDASFDDFIEQFQDPNFGFGNVIGDTGNVWANRVIGFVGDVLLDPTTYIMGAGVISGAGGRTRLNAAARAAAAGFDDKVVQQIGRRGIGSLDDATRQALRESGEQVLSRGLHFKMPFQERYAHIPGSQVLDAAIGRPMTALREGLARTGPFSKLREWRSPEGLEAAYEKLVTGRGSMSPAVAGELITFRNAADRGGKTVLGRLAATARATLGDSTDGDLSALLTQAETMGGTKINDFFNHARKILDDAGVKIDPRKFYVPHIYSDGAADWLRSGVPDSVAFRNAFKITGTDPEDLSPVLMQRQFIPRTEPYKVGGRKVTTQVDGKEVTKWEGGLDFHVKTGTIEEMNSEFARLFPQAGFNLLDDNITSIVARYSKSVYETAGAVSGMKALLNSKARLLRAADSPDTLREVVNEGASKYANKKVREELTNQLSAYSSAAKQVREETLKGLSGIQGVQGVQLRGLIDELNIVEPELKAKLDNLLVQRQELEAQRGGQPWAWKSNPDGSLSAVRNGETPWTVDADGQIVSPAGPPETELERTLQGTIDDLSTRYDAAERERQRIARAAGIEKEAWDDAKAMALADPQFNIAFENIQAGKLARFNQLTNESAALAIDLQKLEIFRQRIAQHRATAALAERQLAGDNAFMSMVTRGAEPDPFEEAIAGETREMLPDSVSSLTGDRTPQARRIRQTKYPRIRGAPGSGYEQAVAPGTTVEAGWQPIISGSQPRVIRATHQQARASILGDKGAVINSRIETQQSALASAEDTLNQVASIHTMDLQERQTEFTRWRDVEAGLDSELTSTRGVPRMRKRAREIESELARLRSPEGQLGRARKAYEDAQRPIAEARNRVSFEQKQLDALKAEQMKLARRMDTDELAEPITDVSPNAPVADADLSAPVRRNYQRINERRQRITVLQRQRDDWRASAQGREHTLAVTEQQTVSRQINDLDRKIDGATRDFNAPFQIDEDGNVAIRYVTPTYTTKQGTVVNRPSNLEEEITALQHQRDQLRPELDRAERAYEVAEADWDDGLRREASGEGVDVRALEREMDRAGAELDGVRADMDRVNLRLADRSWREVEDIRAANRARVTDMTNRRQALKSERASVKSRIARAKRRQENLPEWADQKLKAIVEGQPVKGYDIRQDRLDDIVALERRLDAIDVEEDALVREIRDFRGDEPGLGDQRLAALHKRRDTLTDQVRKRQELTAQSKKLERQINKAGKRARFLDNEIDRITNQVNNWEKEYLGAVNNVRRARAAGVKPRSYYERSLIGINQAESQSLKRSPRPNYRIEWEPVPLKKPKPSRGDPRVGAYTITDRAELEQAYTVLRNRRDYMPPPGQLEHPAVAAARETVKRVEARAARVTLASALENQTIYDSTQIGLRAIEQTRTPLQPTDTMIDALAGVDRTPGGSQQIGYRSQVSHQVTTAVVEAWGDEFLARGAMSPEQMTFLKGRLDELGQMMDQYASSPMPGLRMDFEQMIADVGRRADFMIAYKAIMDAGIKPNDQIATWLMSEELRREAEVLAKKIAQHERFIEDGGQLAVAAGHAMRVMDYEGKYLTEKIDYDRLRAAKAKGEKIDEGELRRVTDRMNRARRTWEDLAAKQPEFLGMMSDDVDSLVAALRAGLEDVSSATSELGKHVEASKAMQWPVTRRSQLEASIPLGRAQWAEAKAADDRLTIAVREAEAARRRTVAFRDYSTPNFKKQSIEDAELRLGQLRALPENHPYRAFIPNLEKNIRTANALLESGRYRNRPTVGWREAHPNMVAERIPIAEARHRLQVNAEAMDDWKAALDNDQLTLDVLNGDAQKELLLLTQLLHDRANLPDPSMPGGPEALASFKMSLRRENRAMHKRAKAEGRKLSKDEMDQVALNLKRVEADQMTADQTLEATFRVVEIKEKIKTAVRRSGDDHNYLEASQDHGAKLFRQIMYGEVRPNKQNMRIVRNLLGADESEIAKDWMNTIGRYLMTDAERRAETQTLMAELSSLMQGREVAEGAAPIRSGQAVGPAGEVPTPVDTARVAEIEARIDELRLPVTDEVLVQLFSDIKLKYGQTEMGDRLLNQAISTPGNETQRRMAREAEDAQRMIRESRLIPGMEEGEIRPSIVDDDEMFGRNADASELDAQDLTNVSDSDLYVHSIREGAIQAFVANARAAAQAASEDFMTSLQILGIRFGPDITSMTGQMAAMGYSLSQQTISDEALRQFVIRRLTDSGYAPTRRVEDYHAHLLARQTRLNTMRRGLGMQWSWTKKKGGMSTEQEQRLFQLMSGQPAMTTDEVVAKAREFEQLVVPEDMQTLLDNHRAGLYEDMGSATERGDVAEQERIAGMINAAEESQQLPLWPEPAGESQVDSVTAEQQVISEERRQEMLAQATEVDENLARVEQQLLDLDEGREISVEGVPPAPPPSLEEQLASPNEMLEEGRFSSAQLYAHRLEVDDFVRSLPDDDALLTPEQIAQMDAYNKQKMAMLQRTEQPDGTMAGGMWPGEPIDDKMRAEAAYNLATGRELPEGYAMIAGPGTDARATLLAQQAELIAERDRLASQIGSMDVRGEQRLEASAEDAMEPNALTQPTQVQADEGTQPSTQLDPDQAEARMVDNAVAVDEDLDYDELVEQLDAVKSEYDELTTRHTNFNDAPPEAQQRMLELGARARKLADQQDAAIDRSKMASRAVAQQAGGETPEYTRWLASQHGGPQASVSMGWRHIWADGTPSQNVIRQYKDVPIDPLVLEMSKQEMIDTLRDPKKTFLHADIFRHLRAIEPQMWRPAHPMMRFESGSRTQWHGQMMMRGSLDAQQRHLDRQLEELINPVRQDMENIAARETAAADELEKRVTAQLENRREQQTLARDIMYGHPTAEMEERAKVSAGRYAHRMNMRDMEMEHLNAEHRRAFEQYNEGLRELDMTLADVREKIVLASTDYDAIRAQREQLERTLNSVPTTTAEMRQMVGDLRDLNVARATMKGVPTPAAGGGAGPPIDRVAVTAARDEARKDVTRFDNEIARLSAAPPAAAAAPPAAAVAPDGRAGPNRLTQDEIGAGWGDVHTPTDAEVASVMQANAAARAAGTLHWDWYTPHNVGSNPRRLGPVQLPQGTRAPSGYHRVDRTIGPAKLADDLGIGGHQSTSQGVNRALAAGQDLWDLGYRSADEVRATGRSVADVANNRIPYQPAAAAPTPAPAPVVDNSAEIAELHSRRAEAEGRFVEAERQLTVSRNRAAPVEVAPIADIEAMLVAASEGIAKLERYEMSEELITKRLDEFIRDAGNGSTFGQVMDKVLIDGWQPYAEKVMKGPDAVIIADQLAAGMKNLSKAMHQAETWGVVAKYTAFFKTYATAKPGFHVRNALSAVFMNAVANVRLSRQIEALGLWRAMTKDPVGTWERVTQRERDALSAVWGSGAAGQFEEVGIGTTTTAMSRTYQRIMNNKITAWNKRAGAAVEGTARLGMALDGIDKGLSAGHVMDRINQFHFNYTEMSKMDRVARQMIPFWTFMSRNLPLQIQQFWLSPRTYQHYRSFTRNFSEEGDPYTPDYWLSQGAFTMDPNAEDAERPWYLAPDMPHLRVAEPFEQIAQGRIGAATLSNVNPLFLAPVEAFGFGKKIYTDQDISNEYSEPTPMMERFMPLFNMLGGTETAGSGGQVLDERYAHLARTLLPPVDLIERLTDTSGTRAGRQGETWARFFGAPVYRLTPELREAQFKREYYDKRDQLDTQADLARM